MDRELFENRKKTLYEFICDDFYVPMKTKEIAIMLRVEKERRGELQEVLDALVEAGKIEVTKKGKYIRATARDCTGVYTANSRGFGFVSVEGEEEDIFISEENKIGRASCRERVFVVV